MRAKKKKKEVLSVELLKIHINGLYKTDFCIKSFQRNFRPFFRFDIVSDTRVILKSKITKMNINITLVDVNRFQIQYSFNPYKFEFSANSPRELVEKLVKHNLI